MAYVESGIYVEGLNAMIAGLKAISSDATKEVQALNFKVGTLVVNEAKMLAPVKTGALQRSIKASRSTRKGVLVTAGNAMNIPYANVQNYGWFYDKNNFIYKRILPQQYMNKAAAKVRARVGEFYIEDLIAIYNKYAKSGDTITKDSYKNKQKDYTIRRND